jgi:hypothetical protein
MSGRLVGWIRKLLVDLHQEELTVLAGYTESKDDMPGQFVLQVVCKRCKTPKATVYWSEQRAREFIQYAARIVDEIKGPPDPHASSIWTIHVSGTSDTCEAGCELHPDWQVTGSLLGVTREIATHLKLSEAEEVADEGSGDEN